MIKYFKIFFKGIATLGGISLSLSVLNQAIETGKVSLYFAAAVLFLYVLKELIEDVVEYTTKEVAELKEKHSELTENNEEDILP
jgi:hypothetical protein